MIIVRRAMFSAQNADHPLTIGAIQFSVLVAVVRALSRSGRSAEFFRVALIALYRFNNLLQCSDDRQFRDIAVWYFACLLARRACYRIPLMLLDDKRAQTRRAECIAA